MISDNRTPFQRAPSPKTRIDKLFLNNTTTLQDFNDRNGRSGTSSQREPASGHAMAETPRSWARSERHTFLS